MLNYTHLQTALILLALVIVFGCNPPNGSEAPPRSLTEKNLQIIKNPDVVVVKRIKTVPGTEEESLSDFKTLTKDQLTEIQLLLTDKNSFELANNKDCLPTPAILIVFSKGSVESEVRICFECIKVGFTPGKWEDVDPIELDLINWSKLVFPNDAAINSLQPR